MTPLRIVVLIFVSFIFILPHRQVLAEPAAQPIADGLFCNATLRLGNGQEQSGPVFVVDHLMFGPIVAAQLAKMPLVSNGDGASAEKAESAKEDLSQPMLTVQFVGMVQDLNDQNLVIISVEGRIEHTVFVPSLNEDVVMGRGAIVLSRENKILSRGQFSMARQDGGAILLECEIK